MIAVYGQDDGQGDHPGLAGQGPDDPPPILERFLAQKSKAEGGPYV